jgi:hypothetical protein
MKIISFLSQRMDMDIGFSSKCLCMAPKNNEITSLKNSMVQCENFILIEYKTLSSSLSHLTDIFSELILLLITGSCRSFRIHLYWHCQCSTKICTGRRILWSWILVVQSTLLIFLLCVVLCCVVKFRLRNLFLVLFCYQKWNDQSV